MQKISQQQLKMALLAGCGAMLCISSLAALEQLTPQTIWLMAPFGATMVLLFALPESPLAQPRNILCGHLLTSLIGLIMLNTLGASPLTLGLAVGLGIAVMMLTQTVHPPAGANPLVAMLTAQHWDFLYTPVASGALLILAFGWLYHNLLCHRQYPQKWF
ncbi:HPP family protein [Shewanella putrefaciens]|uniref:HPP family protein n=1 Tax=Shewanella putrefaciens TaxID=24 RepID=UPI0018E8886B|nr:HPP family protein [Shewanella putrefaciens]